MNYTTTIYSTDQTPKSQYAYFKPHTNQEGIKKTGITTSSHLSPIDYIKAVREGRWKTEVNNVREMMAKHGRNSPEHNAAKVAMPAVILSVDCSSRAGKKDDGEKLIAYNYELQVDLDIHDTQEAVEKRKAELWDAIPHFRHLSISPSGDGLKGSLVFRFGFPVELTGKTLRKWQKHAFLMVSEYLASKGIESKDESVKDPFRLCYCCYDPQALYRDNPEPLIIPEPAPVEVKAKDKIKAVSITPAGATKTTSFATTKTHAIIDKILATMCETIRNTQPAGGTNQKGRHATIVSCAYMIGGYIAGEGYDYDKAYNALLAAANDVKPETADDNPRIVKESIESGKKEPKKVECGNIKALKTAEDISNGFDEIKMGYYIFGSERHDSELFHELFGDVLINFRFEGGHHCFLLYDDSTGKWNRQPDRKGPWFREAFGHIADIYRAFAEYYKNKKEAQEKAEEDEDEIKKSDTAYKAAAGKAFRLTTNAGQKALLEQYENYKQSFELLDTHPNLVSFSNGVYDLDKAVFRPHSPLDYNTQGMTKTAYNPNAKCPNFENFILNVVFEGNQETAQYWWDIMSQGVHGRAYESLFIALGNELLSKNGTNCKSFPTEMIKIILEDYAGSADINLLVDNRGGNANIRREAIAQLYKKRFVVGGELLQETTLRGCLKTVIQGTDMLIGRVLYEGMVSFYYQALTVAYANRAPAIEDGTNAIEKRIDFCPFNAKVSDKERHRASEYKAVYLSERDGILAKLIRHAQAAWRENIKIPQHIKTLKRSKMNQLVERNTLELFIAESGLFRKNKNGHITKDELKMLYDDYLATLPRTNRCEIIPSHNIKPVLASLGFIEKNPRSEGARKKVICGIERADSIDDAMTGLEDLFDDANITHQEDDDDLKPIEIIKAVAVEPQEIETALSCIEAPAPAPATTSKPKSTQQKHLKGLIGEWVGDHEERVFDYSTPVSEEEHQQALKNLADFRASLGLPDDEKLEWDSKAAMRLLASTSGPKIKDKNITLT
jgi:P4 family phage/plasmid primase-like protien